MSKQFEQDGADFYEVVDRAGLSPLDDRLRHVATAPFKVRDFDCEAARQAHLWFLRTFPQYQG